jgi:outer membrane protein assembly factor BamB
VRKGFFGVGTSPLLEDGKLIVNVGGKGGIVAFDAANGQEVWKAPNNDASYSSPTAATVNGARHVFFLTREGIVSLDPSNGKVRFSQRWRSKNPNSVNAATPLVVDDVLFVSACYDTGALAGRIGTDKLEKLWSNDESLSNHYSTSVPLDGYLYGIDGRADIGVAELRCVELKTGTVKWKESPFGCASLLLADGKLIALNEKGELRLIEATPKGYREKARSALLEKPCRAALALSEGRLLGRDPKRLVCWSVKK